MEFTLYYRGPLRASSTKDRRKPEKHVLRKHFHEQLKALWNQTPLSDHRHFFERSPNVVPTHIRQTDDGHVNLHYEKNLTLLHEAGPFQFVPVVSDRLHMVADLTITLLRPEPPGRIVTQGGDIDNRLKTLLDALKIPRESELPAGEVPSEDESPFFCLVADDALITSLDIKTDRLLDPSAKASEVVLLIRVKTRLLAGTMATLGLV